LPIRTAIACSYCARKMPRLVNEAWADCRVVARFHHGDLIAHASVVLCLVVVQRLLVFGSHGLGVKLDQGVLSAYFKKVFGQVGLLDEPLVLQIRSADLRVVLRIAHFIADSAKEIGRPGNIQRQGVDLRLFPGLAVVLVLAKISRRNATGVRRAESTPWESTARAPRAPGRGLP
jgi:hypothetical protein